MTRDSSKRMATWRRRGYEILEHGSLGGQISRRADNFLVALIIVNLVAVVLESVPSIGEPYAVWFDAIEFFSLAVFSLEYAARLWTSPEHPPYRHMTAVRARLKYAISVSGIVDLLAVAPFWFAMAVPEDLRALLVLRFVRFLKITRYSPAMRSLLDVLYQERRALFGCFVIMCGAALMSATLVYLAERHVQPDRLGTIPDALWWAVVTLGTIGYGDVVPVTALGRFIASATIMLGLVIFALPVGIIATAFAEQIHKRDFVVTWGMIARVPLFAELSASEIAEIMRLLRAQVAEAGQIIVRHGDLADSMYFIAAGEVEIDLRPKKVRLGVGQFFGEVAVLRRARRSATVVAVTRTSLLALDAHDLHALMQRDPRVAERINDVAAKRVSQNQLTPRGDIVSDEIAGGEPPRE